MLDFLDILLKYLLAINKEYYSYIQGLLLAILALQSVLTRSIIRFRKQKIEFVETLEQLKVEQISSVNEKIEKVLGSSEDRAKEELDPVISKLEETEKKLEKELDGFPCKEVSIFFSTNRKVINKTNKVQFGTDCTENSYGKCIVRIPKKHEFGKLESPNILSIILKKDKENFVHVHDTKILNKEDFRATVIHNKPKYEANECMVFIHGYWTSFDDAARRTAQLSEDLNFTGVPFMFSWPSKNKWYLYSHDENNVEVSIPKLKEFINSLIKDFNFEKIHLIAHSMGNRILTKCMQDITDSINTKEQSLINELILAAPDIDERVLREDILPKINMSVKRTTLYASKKDIALKLSKIFHGYLRAGEWSDKTKLTEYTDTINASHVDTSLYGHSYFSGNRSVINDIYHIVKNNLPPENRNLKKIEHAEYHYWEFPE